MGVTGGVSKRRSSESPIGDSEGFKRPLREDNAIIVANIPETYTSR